MNVIFDLDGTVIDSDHRRATLPDGSLDLAHWIENNHPEMIARDSLLPLAQSMKNCRKAGYHIVVCTARAIQSADIAFLADHGLEYDAILHRVLGDNQSDATLKADLLSRYFKGDFSRTVMFDDNLSVIAKMLEIGIKCYDATDLNKQLAA